MRWPVVYWLIAAAAIANVVIYLWPEPTPPPAVSGKSLGKLVLLRELEGKTAVLRPLRPNTGDQPASRAPVAEVAPGASRCWLAGPVADEDLSARLAAEFAAAGISMDLVLQTTEADPIHWVFIRTAGSQADVRRLSRALQDAGWENFPITDGPLAGSLSMGLFRSEQRAVAFRDRLLRTGYAADIYQRTTYREQPWIALDEGGRVALDWPAREGGVPGYRELSLLVRECP